MSISTELNLGALLSAEQTTDGIQITYNVSDPDNHIGNNGLIINSITVSSSIDGGVTFPPAGVLVNTAEQGYVVDKSTLPATVVDSRFFPAGTNILYGLIITTNMGEIDPVGVNVVVGGQVGTQAPLSTLIKKKKGKK